MRIIELFEEKKEKKIPHLYLDMDGVQADFFGEWAKMNGVNSYKEISDPERAIADLANSGPEKVYNFFAELKPLSGGQRIIKWLHANKIPFTVLSAPLRGRYSRYSILGKQDWLNMHNPGASERAIFTPQKYKYAQDKDGDPNVLVDDHGKYLDAWKEHGGIAIKHKDSDTDRTIRQLEQIYGKYLDK